MRISILWGNCSTGGERVLRRNYISCMNSVIGIRNYTSSIVPAALTLPRCMKWLWPHGCTSLSTDGATSVPVSKGEIEDKAI